MSDKLEPLLSLKADEGWSLTVDRYLVHITASTRSPHANSSDAVAGAKELLDGMLVLGYRLKGGEVGAEAPAFGDGEGLWRGELAVTLIEEQEYVSPFDRPHLRSV
jgi:hypothetical protein